MVLREEKPRVSACRAQRGPRSGRRCSGYDISIVSDAGLPLKWVGACMALSRREVTVTCGQGSQSAPGAPAKPKLRARRWLSTCTTDTTFRFSLETPFDVG